MKEKNDKITSEPIMKIMSGTWLAQTLHVAVDLGMFTKIAKGNSTVEKIAKDLSIEKRPAEMLLNACVALSLLVKNGETYGNTPVADKFLVKNSPDYYGDMISLFGVRDVNGWANLKQAVLTNSITKDTLPKRMEDIALAKQFTKAMHSNSVEPAIILSKKFNFSNFTKLLDLGGGSGAYPIILTKQYSNLTATVFDFPNVCSIAKEFIKKEGVESKVNTFNGNFFKDDFPKDHDIILLSQIFHSWGTEENKNLLKKVYDYLPENGMVIINEFLLNEEKTGPLFSALFALNMLIASKKGNTYTEEEIKSWLKDAGFEYQETIPLTGTTTSIIARK